MALELPSGPLQFLLSLLQGRLALHVAVKGLRLQLHLPPQPAGPKPPAPRDAQRRSAKVRISVRPATSSSQLLGKHRLGCLPVRDALGVRDDPLSLQAAVAVPRTDVGDVLSLAAAATACWCRRTRPSSWPSCTSKRASCRRPSTGCWARGSASRTCRWVLCVATWRAAPRPGVSCGASPFQSGPEPPPSTAAMQPQFSAAAPAKPSPTAAGRATASRVSRQQGVRASRPLRAPQVVVRPWGLALDLPSVSWQQAPEGVLMGAGAGGAALQEAAPPGGVLEVLEPALALRPDLATPTPGAGVQGRPLSCCFT